MSMPVNSSSLSSLPIFKGMTPSQLGAFCERFSEVRCDAGECLFEAGAPADHLDLLLGGAVTLYDGELVVMTLRAPAIIGELGVLTGLNRNTTARAIEPSELLRIGREDLLGFLATNAEVSFLFYQNLLALLGDKIKRDDRRMDEMRRNIMTTQKAMKKLRDYVLAQRDTTISEAVHDTLESQIDRNRRVNYLVVPPQSIPAIVRLSGGSTHRVLAMSRQRLFLASDGQAGDDDNWKGVLIVPGTEIPLDGKARMVNDYIEVEIGLLISEYESALENYLTRAQILDVVV